jgi:uncharacterized protein
MTTEIARQAVDYIHANHPVNTGLIFFGGEPLLKKDLITDTIEYANKIRRKTGFYMHYKVTTNGVLLDEDFFKFAEQNHLEISLSLDGIKETHDRFRHFADGSGTFDLLQPKIDLLLKYQPYAKALITITPETLDHYAESFEYLVNRGFKYVVASLNYAAEWTDDDVLRLKKQYQRIAKLYEQFINEERKFYFSPFEMKFASHIKQDNIECYQCHLGVRQISISHSGEIYPCVQFVKDGVSNREYGIGNIFEGIDREKQKKMYLESKLEDEVCKTCDYYNRCNNKCSCLNWQLTGEINKISPKICECERILIPIVDSLGKKMFNNHRSMFVQKHYNAIYPILSMLEDRGLG